MEDFYAWLRRDKYTIALTILCAVLPLLSGIKISIKSEIIQFLWDHSTAIINILFLLGTLIALTGTRFLINRDKKKSGELFAYVKHNFGENCLLYNLGEQKLFRQMSAGVSQFYYSWLIVWGMWLALYTANFIFDVYKENISLYCLLDASHLERLKNIVENFLNIANSVVFFFIYLVITISTIDAKSVESRQRTLHIGVIILIFMAILIFFIEFFSLLMPCCTYFQIQFWIRLLVGIIAIIAMVSVIGRLDSSYLCIPQWLIITLYLYAGVQAFYPLLYLLKCDTGRIGLECVTWDSYTLDKYSMSGTNILQSFVSTISIIGKFCLFLMIRWIATQKRFLFYLLQKANSKSESVAMWREFYKGYEGCPDKE